MLHLGGADADDAVQHALTQAALGKRPPGMPLGTFLRITLKRHAWNLRKLAGRRRAREGAAAGDPTVMPVDDPATQPLRPSPATHSACAYA